MLFQDTVKMTNDDDIIIILVICFILIIVMCLCCDIYNIKKDIGKQWLKQPEDNDDLTIEL